MINNSYFSEYINKLNNLTGDQIEDPTLLDVFCEYISSNLNFKYNGTYLTDSVTVFKEKLNIYNQKKDLITQFKNKISINYDSLEGWYIIFDNLYVLTPTFEIKLLLNFDKYDYFNNLIDQFNLFKLDSDYISIRYVKVNVNSDSLEIESEYFENQKIKSNNSYKEIELFSMVKKALAPKNNSELGENDGE